MPPNFWVPFCFISLLGTAGAVPAIGVNWGTEASHPLPAPKVVELLKSNNINKVKLFDANSDVLRALSGSNIAVTVGIPNVMLKTLNLSKKAADSWVHDNITRYFSSGGNAVRIEYISVGDEPFLQSYTDQFHPFVLGAAINIQAALIQARLQSKVKVVVPCSLDVFQSQALNVSSKSHFRPDLNKTMLQLLQFLDSHSSSFFVTISPFLMVHQNKNFSLDLALFKDTVRPISDGLKRYKNYFDMSYDTAITALSEVGYPNMNIVVAKIGWPTDGAANATSFLAETFMKGLINHINGKLGTSWHQLTEIYIFSLLDEDQRSITSGDFERHWGIYTFDGQAKYHIDLGQGSKALVNAKNVAYLFSKWCVVNDNKDLSNATAAALDACASADCAALSPGGSCFNIGWPSNISYAFNSYYQQHDQSADSCDFSGLGLITTVDPSVDSCRFPIQILASNCDSCSAYVFHLITFVIAILFEYFPNLDRYF